MRTRNHLSPSAHVMARWDSIGHHLHAHLLDFGSTRQRWHAARPAAYVRGATPSISAAARLKRTTLQSRPTTTTEYRSNQECRHIGARVIGGGDSSCARWTSRIAISDSRFSVTPQTASSHDKAFGCESVRNPRHPEDSRAMPGATPEIAASETPANSSREAAAREPWRRPHRRSVEARQPTARSRRA